MATHTLTDDQMRKFADAVGGTRCSKPLGGTFITDHLKKIVELIGGLHDWPKLTDDPRVNFAVDCVVEDDGEEPEYDEEVYAKEAATAK